ncbi:MAG: ABC transporter ATP-binding protein [Acidobacteriota bacterium]|nr:ABC transporter ATP-binding protein [Acidobacteriota bacterium]
MIEIVGLVKEYGKGHAVVRALRGIDLIVDTGEMLGLAGTSGSGKTTLLNILGCLDRPTSGSVLIDGQDTSGMKEKELTRYRGQTIGFMFQDFNLFQLMNVEENVEFPLAIVGVPGFKRRERVASMLARVGLEGKERRFPDQLSAGEKQRVAIARALVHRPRLVLADEPTANLDNRTARGIIDLLLDLNREMMTTFVIASHDPALLGRLPRVAYMEDGVILDTVGPGTRV